MAVPVQRKSSRRRRATTDELLQVEQFLSTNLSVARRELVNAGKRAVCLMDAGVDGAAEKHMRISEATAALDAIEGVA